MSSRPFIGVATPQANPTVEIEFRRLLSGRAEPLATRLTSSGHAPGERLVEYLEQIYGSIRSFDTLELAAFAFACTGSSYLVGPEREAELVRTAEAQFGLPVITATRAIASELALRNARRIAILAPYPDFLIEASVDYWTERGFEVTACERIDVGEDTRAIYTLTDQEVRDAVSRFDPANADMTLLSGTGMPTLAVLDKLPGEMTSSNLCLATAALRAAGSWPTDRPADLRELGKN